MVDVVESNILDFEQLLKPISDDNPVGEYLRYEGVYDQVEEFRKEDDPNLPQGVWQTDLKSADWSGVRELTTKTLSSQSKDLQLAGWLLESLIFLEGAAGVAEGIKLIFELSTEFWDDIYPAIEEDDLEFRASPFLWLNSVLSEKLKNLWITKPEIDDCEPFSFNEWEKMVHLETLAKQSATARKSLDGEMKCTRSEFNRSVNSTPVPFLVQTRESLQNALSTTRELSDFLDEKCGKSSPSLEQIKKNLESIESQINLLIGKRDTSKADDMAEEETAGESGGSITEPFRFDPGSRIKSREEAYHFLSEIAEYLMETDPHSPVPFLVKRAVNWGSMSLGELLTELMKDGQNLQQIYSLLGIQE